MAKEDLNLHIIIMGSRQAGISSFINQKEGDYEPNDETGVGIDIQTTPVFVDNKEYILTFYEIAGTFPLDSLRKIFLKKHVALAVMFDMSNNVSLELAELLFTQVQSRIQEKTPRVKFLLASHLDVEQKVPQEAVDALLEIMGPNTSYLEFSSKTGENVVESLETIAKKILGL